MFKLTLLLLLLITIEVHSQEDNTQELKWEFGLDLRSFMDTSYHMKESIIAKRRINDKYKHRFRFGIYFDDVHNFSTREPILGGIKGYRPKVYLSYGIEKYLFRNEFLYIGVGVDLFTYLKYHVIKDHFDNTGYASPPDIIDTEIIDKDLRLGVNPIINCELKLTKFLSISVEAFCQIAYRHEHYTRQEYEENKTILTKALGRNKHYFYTQLQPFSSINIIIKL